MSETLETLRDEIRDAVRRFDSSEIEYTAGRAGENVVYYNLERKNTDVLILSRFPLNRTHRGMVEDLTESTRASVASWSFFCVSAAPIDPDDWGRFSTMAKLKCQDMKTEDDKPLPWDEWALRGIKIIRPTCVVILTWGREDTDFKPFWPTHFFIPYEGTIRLPHPARSEHGFKKGWIEQVDPVLEAKLLRGAKRLPDGSAVDAFAALTAGAARAEKRARKVAALPKDSETSSTHIGGENFTIPQEEDGGER